MLSFLNSQATKDESIVAGLNIVSVRKFQRGRVIERKVDYGKKRGMLIYASTASREVSYAEFAKKGQHRKWDPRALALALAVRFGQNDSALPRPLPYKEHLPAT